MTQLHPTKERFASFILMLRRNAPKTVSDNCLMDYAAELIKQAKVLHRLSIAECERDLTQRELDTTIRTNTKVRLIMDALLMPYRHQSGDPRGFSILMFPPDGSRNSFSGEGYGVPLD